MLLAGMKVVCVGPATGPGARTRRGDRLPVPHRRR